MEVSESNRKNPQSELPERYTPLVEYASRGTLSGLSAAFDSAFRRIEGRRLVAEHNLRKALQRYWSMNREDLNALRPFDFLHCFQEYAEASFKAAGEECLALFQDLERYRSFLHIVQDWVLGAIFPKPETLKQSRARMLGLAEWARPLVEHAMAEGLWDRPPALQLDALIDDLRDSAIQTPDEPRIERLTELILQKRIIGLRETFSAFEERCTESSDGLLFSWGGDWEHLLDDSLVDAYRTGSDSLGASAVGSAIKGALRKAGNREEAKEFWTVALEQLHATLLAAWWNMSAEVRSRGANTDRLDAHAENDRRAPTSDASTGRRAPKEPRRSRKYMVIDKALQKIAESRPSTQEEVFESLDGRHVVIPPAEPFVAARGWIAGFRRDDGAARAWLSKRWTGLKLSPLPRGPKNPKK
jgi:hypothetical protein